MANTKTEPHIVDLFQYQIKYDELTRGEHRIDLNELGKSLQGFASFGVLGFFGEVPFTCSSEQVATFNDVQVQHQSRYANHDILGQKPVHEYVGHANSTVSFKFGGHIKINNFLN